MKVIPLSDFILIDPLEKETTLPSGLVIPDTAKEKPSEGKVVAVGLESTVQEGNIVMYRKWAGTEIKVDGKDMMLVKQEDVLAILEK